HVYSKHLSRLNGYNKLLNGTKESHDEILKIQGYSDLKTKLELEWAEEDLYNRKISSENNDVSKKLRAYSKKKKEVNA
ncbi:hypothetical protein NSX51_24385, partial [Salmonella enterica]|nr:hypothetical protein [Salmonella enterica]